MTILALRILPALAIARLGSANTPVEAYRLEEDSERPLNFRHITPMRTFEVDESTGEICNDGIPGRITFKEAGRIRPVAPFLEVFAVTDDGQLLQLDKNLLAQNGATPADISWTVSVANRKVFRRTADAKDIVASHPVQFSDHKPHQLVGVCPNFVNGGSINFGHVRYIKPTDRYPHIRLRFTPAKGLIYGPDKPLADPAAQKNPIPADCAIYDSTKKWRGFQAPKPEDKRFFNETLPPALFANQALKPVWLNNDVAVSRGYFDDACDGSVHMELRLPDRCLNAAARICSAPPIVAPDAQFVRTLMDDLEQILLGPGVPKYERFAVTRERAEHIVRRAAETVRFLNLVVMNGNSVKGLAPLTLDTMPAEEAFATKRMMRPIMSENTVDTLTVLGLHEQLLAALRGGTAPWFLRLLRQPEEVADFTDRGRRKMPAMMCGSDSNYLALTYRQIHTLGVVARHQPSDNDLPATTPLAHASSLAAGLIPQNRTAELQYVGTGNPISSHPMTAVGNCCPGLEVDFRAVWRRMLDGIELREYDNVVMAVTDSSKQALLHQRLLRVDGVQVVTQMLGPAPADPKTKHVVVALEDNPSGVASLEWSNTFAKTLWDKMGKVVRCDFTMAKLADEHEIAPPQMWGDENYPPAVRLPFRVRHFFDADTVVISDHLAKDGELTQGLCSPWQNDYRECSCYYWAASRPDFVNVEPSKTGLSIGDNWLQKERTKDYVPDDYADSRLVLYEDLFKEWETWLRFQIGGRDAEDSGNCISSAASS